MVTNNPWVDDTGMVRKYGTLKATANIAGEYRLPGNLREIALTLDLTTIGSTPTIISYQTFFPKSRVEEVRVTCLTAATAVSSTAKLNLGLIKTDTTTNISQSGFLTTLALSTINSAGKVATLNLGSASAGALLGTTTTDVGYLTADWDSEAFTAGSALIQIRYHIP